MYWGICCSGIDGESGGCVVGADDGVGADGVFEVGLADSLVSLVGEESVFGGFVGEGNDEESGEGFVGFAFEVLGDAHVVAELAAHGFEEGGHVGAVGGVAGFVGDVEADDDFVTGGGHGGCTLEGGGWFV